MAVLQVRCNSVGPATIKMLALALGEQPALPQSAFSEKLQIWFWRIKLQRSLATPQSENLKLAELLVHIVEFGSVIADALHSGSKIATGNSTYGFHPVDITLRGPLSRVTNIGLDEAFEVPDVPTYRKLQRISQRMKLARPEVAIDRLCYWFYIASVVAWLHNPIFVMDHQGESWREFRYPPLWEARNRFAY